MHSIRIEPFLNLTKSWSQSGQLFPDRGGNNHVKEDFETVPVVSEHKNILQKVSLFNGLLRCRYGFLLFCIFLKCCAEVLKEGYSILQHFSEWVEVYQSLQVPTILLIFLMRRRLKNSGILCSSRTIILENILGPKSMETILKAKHWSQWLSVRVFLLLRLHFSNYIIGLIPAEVWSKFGFETRQVGLSIWVKLMVLWCVWVNILRRASSSLRLFIFTLWTAVAVNRNLGTTYFSYTAEKALIFSCPLLEQY